MIPAIHQQATEATAPPQRGELDTTRLIKSNTNSTNITPKTSAGAQTLSFLWCIFSASMPEFLTGLGGSNQIKLGQHGLLISHLTQLLTQAPGASEPRSM